MTPGPSCQITQWVLLIEPKEPSTLWLAQVMARGWESKAVESQMEAARSDQAAASKERVTPDKADAHRKKETLLLARTYLLQQLQSSQNPRHREIIEKALAGLEKQLALTEEVH